MDTNLVRVLLLNRKRLNRGRILPHLLESVYGVVSTAGPTAMARAGRMLGGVDEASDDVPGGRSR